MSEAPQTELAYYKPTIHSRLRRAWMDTKHAMQSAIDATMRRVGYVRFERDSNLVRHAMREFKAAKWDLESDDMQKLMCDQVCELLGVYSTHGHSGSSAPYANSMFTKLASFEPLVPLTGEAWEWNEVSEGCFQNNRCSHVFKDADQFNGQAYDLDARIFRDPNGGCYTNGDSRQPITFPYTPTREYVDVRR